MKRHEVTVEHLFRLSDRGIDPSQELDLVRNIERYVPDPHLFAMSYANYAQTVRELCSGEPEPVSQFLQRWPHVTQSI